MSLCIAQKGINGNLFVGADSRVSAYAADGSLIRTGENIDKIRVLPDGSLIFISGLHYTLECILNDFCKNIGQGCKGIKDAQRLASLMQLHAEQITAEQLQHRQNNKLLTAMLYITVENGNIAGYVICNVLKDSAGKCTPQKTDIANSEDLTAYIGATDKKIEAFFTNSYNQDHTVSGLVESFFKTYDFAASEQTGGVLTVYELSHNGIENVYKHHIIDKTAHLNLYGLNILNKNTGQPSFSIDNTGNVAMHSGSISWDSPVIEYQYSADNASWHTSELASDKWRREKQLGQVLWGAGYQYKGVDGKPGADGSDANVPPYVMLKGLDFTSITGNYIKSPTIYGGKIYAGDGNNYAEMESTAFSLYQKGVAGAKASLYLYDGSDNTYAALSLGAGYQADTSGRMSQRFYIEKKTSSTELYMLNNEYRKVGFKFDIGSNGKGSTITLLDDTKFNVPAVFA